MRFCRALLALVLLAAVAPAGEITLIKGDVIKCDIVSVSNKEVVYKVDGKELRKPTDEVLKIEYREPEKAPAGKGYAQVEFTDGTVVLVSQWGVKKKDFEMKLVAGPAVKMPVEFIANVLNNADLEVNRREWKTRVYNTRGKEAIVVSKDNVVSNIVCTIGEGDETGEAIQFAVVLEDEPKPKTYTRKVKELHGLIFNHLLSPKAPRIVCRLLDTNQDVVMVSSVEPLEGGGLRVTTPAGAKMEFNADQIAGLDYTKGKLDFLSALTPANIKITPNAFEVGDARDKWFVYKDSNLDNRPIKLAGIPYRFGLTLLPDVELTYDLGGRYREFSAFVGIDDETRAEGEVTLVIEADGKELASVPIVYKTERGKNNEPKKPARPHRKLELNIKDVQKLTVRLKQKDELSGLSISVSLGDAKVNK